MTLEQRNDPHVSPEGGQEKKLSRRQLFKALIAAGGAVTASTMLPARWTKPVVEVGVLPAHAQVSPVPTDTPEPPRVRIDGCRAHNADGSPVIQPDDTIETDANILPIYQDILLEMTVTITQTSHSLVGQVVNRQTARTDATGHSPNLYYDLSTLSPPIGLGDDALLIIWQIIDPTVIDAGDACGRDITIG